MAVKFKLYEYVWHDHAFSSGWRTSVDKDKYLVLGVGYLVDEDKDHYYFTSGLVPTSGQYHGVMTIVKSALVKKKLLKTLQFDKVN